MKISQMVSELWSIYRNVKDTDGWTDGWWTDRQMDGHSKFWRYNIIPHHLFMWQGITTVTAIFDGNSDSLTCLWDLRVLYSKQKLSVLHGCMF